MFTEGIAWLEAHQLPCPVKLLFHVDCPGCGLQRSLLACLKGELGNSLHCHPAGIPLLLFLLFSAAHLYFKFREGERVIVYSYIFIAVIILTNFFYKLLQNLS